VGIILDTARLRLREMTHDDLDFVAAMLADPEVSRYYERRFTRADARDWLDRQCGRYERDGHGLWLAIERASDRPVGQIGIATQEVEGVRHPEVGWLLDRPFWGRGYATEAGAACRDAGFERWHYDHLISLIRPVNTPSIRVAERIGMSPGPRVQFYGFEHIMFRTEAPRSVRPAAPADAPGRTA
jgi:RimJ/RimL family protein N-acetyltransferase